MKNMKHNRVSENDFGNRSRQQRYLRHESGKRPGNKWMEGERDDTALYVIIMGRLHCDPESWIPQSDPAICSLNQIPSEHNQSSRSGSLPIQKVWFVPALGGCEAEIQTEASVRPSVAALYVIFPLSVSAAAIHHVRRPPVLFVRETRDLGRNRRLAGWLAGWLTGCLTPGDLYWQMKSAFRAAPPRGVGTRDRLGQGG